LMNEKEIDEAVDYFQHKIIPELNPSVSGVFQVRLVSTHNGPGDAGMAEIELRIVDPKTKAVLKSFGSKAISVGRTITLQGLESKINFLPQDFKI